MIRSIKIILIFLAMIGIIIAAQSLRNVFVAAEESEVELKSNSAKESAVSLSSPAGVSENDQLRCNSFIRKCEDATLLFTEISGLNNFVDTYKDAQVKPEGYVKLSDYASYYSQAYDMVAKLIRGEHEYMDVYAYKAACRNIMQEPYTKYREELKLFRQGFQSIYLVRSENLREDSHYIEFVLFEGGRSLREASNFRELERIRKRYIIEYEQVY